jgi:hypothetical protein
MLSRQFQLILKPDGKLSPKLWSKMDLIRADFAQAFVAGSSRVPDAQFDMFLIFSLFYSPPRRDPCLG